MNLHDWLADRQQNALRIAGTKRGADRDGWLEDADYLRRAVESLDEAERLAQALERIAGFTVSQFMGPHDMALECVNVAREALDRRTVGNFVAELTAAETMESIAREWDGCMAPMFDPAGNPTGAIDVGATIRAHSVAAVCPPAPRLADIPDTELPGMWERADFEDGQDEVRGPDTSAVRASAAPLSEERLHELATAAGFGFFGQWQLYQGARAELVAFARAVEAAHGVALPLKNQS